MKTIFSPAELIRFSIEIENRIDERGDLVPLEGKESTLFLISRYDGGYAIFYRYDIPGELRIDIIKMGFERALDDHAAVQAILNRYAPCQKAFAGKGYTFAHLPSPAEYPDVEVENRAFIIKVDGKPVSWAWTQDGSSNADELAVETLPEYRRRGYARQVVAAWASAVLQDGRVAFYSHKVDNIESEKLALSLGVVLYAVSTAYS